MYAQMKVFFGYPMIVTFQRQLGERLMTLQGSIMNMSAHLCMKIWSIRLTDR